MSRRTLIQLGVVIITIAAATPLFAIPASPALAWLEQPDGTRFQARQWGDEWLSGWETAEGYTVVRDDATGWWYFAVRSPEGALVAGAKAVGVEGPPQEVQRHLRPAFQELEPALQLRAQGIEKLRARAQAVTGTRNVPVFLVTFSDRSPTYSTSQFNQMLFATGANSLRDYYREVSYNQLAVAGTVNGWYTAPQGHDYYGWDAGSEFEQKDWRVGDLVRAVAESADASGFDFAPYDTDGDCKVDIFAVVHQGTDQADSNGSPTDIWSHQSSLTYQNQHKGASRGAYVTNDACRAGGAVTVDDYVIQPENAADGGMVTVGVFAHEYAHALGLPDLYDYATDDTDSWGVGIWSLMSAGNFLGTSREGDRPGHLDPWSKIVLGWVTPQLVTGTRTNEAISPATTAADVYQLLSGNVDAGGEYFLVENRQKSGFDTGLPAGGVLVWHIDDSWWPSNYRINDNECYPGGPSCASQHYHVAVVQADGLWELEKYIHPGNAGDLFPGSTNNTSFTANSTPSSALYSGAASNVSITSIASGGSGGTMTATLSVTSGGGSGGQAVTIYSDGFEGAFPGSFGLYPSSATTTWGKSSYRKVTGNYSLWCAGGGSNAQPAGGQYVANMETWFYYGPFSLADATAATAEFDVWYETESSYDFVKLMLSVNGQNFYGYQWSGSSSGWQHVVFNFADVTQIQAIGAPQVWIAGIFTSDGSTQYEGAYVDNLVIKKTTAGQSCTYSISPPSQSFSSAAGTGSVSVTASGTSCSWTASSGVSWVTITSGASGTGNGTVTYSVAANSSTSSSTSGT
jgi:M6 family metalloprotease-like protein